MSKTYICIEEMRQGTATYIPGDKLDVDRFIASGVWTERLAAQLLERNQYGELTPQLFRDVIARRPHGAAWPPQGFTQAYLEAQGLVTAEAVPPKPPKAKAAPGKPPVPETPVITEVPVSPDRIQIGANFMQSRKSGNFTFWDVTDTEGRLLRASSFRQEEKAREFLEQLSTEAPSAGTSTADAAEKTNGGDVQSSAD